MKNITLTTNGGREIIVNWDNVDYAKSMTSPYKDEYVEVSFGDHNIDVKETLQEIHEKCHNKRRRDANLDRELASGLLTAEEHKNLLGKFPPYNE